MRSLTLYCSTPINETDVANKAYVDSKSSSDVSFLMKKEFAGDLVSNEGFISATGDLCTLTAAAGKDLYIARAKLVWSINSTDLQEAPAQQAELKINGVIVETCTVTIQMTGSGGGLSTASYEFKNMGLKVAPTEIIKIEIIAIHAAVDVEGFISAVQVDTGVDPTL